MDRLPVGFLRYSVGGLFSMVLNQLTVKASIASAFRPISSAARWLAALTGRRSIANKVECYWSTRQASLTSQTSSSLSPSTLKEKKEFWKSEMGWEIVYFRVVDVFIRTGAPLAGCLLSRADEAAGGWKSLSRCGQRWWTGIKWMSESISRPSTSGRNCGGFHGFRRRGDLWQVLHRCNGWKILSLDNGGNVSTSIASAAELKSIDPIADVFFGFLFFIHIDVEDCGERRGGIRNASGGLRR